MVGERLPEDELVARRRILGIRVLDDGQSCRLIGRPATGMERAAGSVGAEHEAARELKRRACLTYVDVWKGGHLARHGVLLDSSRVGSSTGRGSAGSGRPERGARRGRNDAGEGRSDGLPKGTKSSEGHRLVCTMQIVRGWSERRVGRFVGCTDLRVTVDGR